MGKGSKIGGLGHVIDKESLLSAMWGWSAGRHGPELGGEITLAREDELGAEEDGNCGGGEV
jgi:hypothetical protein